jgi:Holliday junction DNA helicase RuvA
MIATITGKVTAKTGTSVIVETAGVGYEISVITSDNQNLPQDSEAKLFVHEHLREDAHTLYGFIKPDTKLIFEKLISVSGVGPKVAMAILSTISIAHLSRAITSGQSSVLQSVPGVGKKVADRIIVELQNSLETGGSLENQGVQPEDSVFAALRQLGYSTQAAREAASAVPLDIKSEEERIKQALKHVSSR